MQRNRDSFELLVKDKHWLHLRLQTKLTKVVDATLSGLPKTLRFPCTLTLLLTNNAAIRKLNRHFRGIDKATNVLSFPQFEPDQLTKNGKERQSVHIGDIAMGYQYIVAEAKIDNKILINHVTHLLIHGILHLFGYDHSHGTEAVRMERLEKKIMAQLGLPDPYAPSAKTPLKPLSKRRKHTP